MVFIQLGKKEAIFCNEAMAPTSDLNVFMERIVKMQYDNSKENYCSKLE